MDRSTKIYYFEFFVTEAEHNRLVLTVGEVDDFHKNMEEYDPDSAEFDWVDGLADRLGENHAFDEVVYNWPKIRKELEKESLWGAMWEAGSHAISLNNMLDAVNKTGRVEMQVTTEDWK